MEAFRTGRRHRDDLAGHHEPAEGETPPVPVESRQAPGGRDGWSDTWMINSKTKHIDCAYTFIDT
jgi:hypothetical protein